jgi:hypothetical protein
MDDLFFVYATAAVAAIYFLAHALSRRFDPFAPVWLFLIGYLHIYVIQATGFHEWAIGVRGKELVDAASWRAFWALVWFLACYHLPVARWASARLPRPPAGWSPGVVAVISPFLIVWGLICGGMLLSDAAAFDTSQVSGEEAIFRAFPFVMMVAAVMMIVTGRGTGSTRPVFLAAGLLTAAAYVVIWVFNGKRSHSLIGVLATVCAFYITRVKRPNWPALLGTAFAGSLVVAIAIGWRNNPDYERSLTGLLEFVGDFQLDRVLQNLDLAEKDDIPEQYSHETSEYGGYLLILDTVPQKSGFDYGANYIRVVSTFIPRLLWPSKPIYGREAWINAWTAGSEFERADDFTGPAIGILGGAQLNGGAVATVIVLALAAIALRVAYEYFRRHESVPWVQFFWAIFFYNAWFMVVTDDPMVWFYYNWGFSTFPIVAALWWLSKLATPHARPETAGARPAPFEFAGASGAG